MRGRVVRFHFLRVAVPRITAPPPRDPLLPLNYSSNAAVQEAPYERDRNDLQSVPLFTVLYAVVYTAWPTFFWQNG